MLPTVHYNMGGIPTNYRGEALDPTEEDPDRIVPGLMAVGEAGCASVHGANRLGSNSLIDLVVFGRAAAIRAGEVVERATPNRPLNPASVDAAVDRFDALRYAEGGTPMQFRTDRQRVQGLGTAGDGVGHWWSQRLTSIALVPLTLVFLFPFAQSLGPSFEGCARPTAIPSTRWWRSSSSPSASATCSRASRW